MENYIGKICPFCKTEIKEGEQVIVCNECNIPHHESCWQENHGCTTFGCSQKQPETQGTNPTSVCENCGSPMGDGQMFCSNCGTAKKVPQNKVCPKCGATIADGQSFCSSCGHNVNIPVDNNLNNAINQFNAGIETQKKKSKSTPIIIAIILAIVAAIGIFAFNSIQAKKAEEAREDYIAAAEEFLDLAYTAGVNLEDIADTIQEYWYENIWEDKHGRDINEAIAYALAYMSDEIDDAEGYNTRLSSLYSKLKKVPEEAADEDLDELEEICNAVKELYSVYESFYSLATEPTGSYNTYSESNNDTTDEFIEAYRDLKNILE